MEEGSKKSEVLNAALAGLLHDVGKMEQRAKDDSWNPPDDVGNSGQPVHAAWSLRVAGLVPDKYKQAALAGGYHHAPERSPAQDKFLSKLVALADKLSAGERSDPVEKNKSKNPPMQLISIFDRIQIDGQLPQPGDHFLPLEPLTLGTVGNYIKSKKTADPNSRAKYDQLRMDLETAAKQDFPDFEAYLENMLYAMQRLTWCIPSAYYYSIPDVSLYDHSRMTAAVAACLSDQSEGTVDALHDAVVRNFQNKPAADDADLLSQNAALLIGGDISGVQDFIYTITNKGATSSLRGRSFYLQLLTEASARFVLRELGLPVTNIIYAGGGNFYILARASDKNRLEDLRQKLSRILYKHHRGDLYIAVAGLELKVGDFLKSPAKNKVEKHPLSGKWGELALMLAQVKNRRFSELTDSELEVIFKPHGHGGNEDKECKVCGWEHPKTRSANGEAVRKCPACASYEKLGDDLRSAKYIGWSFLEHPQTQKEIVGNEISSGCEEVLNDLGFKVTVSGDFNKAAGFERVWALSDDAYNHAPRNTDQIVIRRMLVNVTPRLEKEFVSADEQIFQKGGTKPFEKLAKESKGIVRLGVFRADVDNLGKIFSGGLGGYATLSRIASLSFAVSLFFEGWVGHIAEKRNEKNGDKLYAIYSGGDDLFFVGSWDELTEFALDVRNDLEQYSGGHPGIHISGGMALVTEKYPLAKAAYDAEEAEKKAKNHIWYRSETKFNKNAFCFLGQPLDWETFSNARTLKLDLQDPKIIEKINRTSVIRKLLENHALYSAAEKDRHDKGKDKSAQGKPQTLYGPWNWRMVYTLKRNLKGKEDFITRVSDPSQMEWIGVAARWAELEER